MLNVKFLMINEGVPRPRDVLLIARFAALPVDGSVNQLTSLPVNQLFSPVVCEWNVN